MLEYNHPSQVQQELQHLEQKRQSYIIQMGESMYGMWRSNQFSREEFEALCREIQGCEQAIDECRRSLETPPPPPPAPDWGPAPQMTPPQPTGRPGAPIPPTGDLGGPQMPPPAPAGWGEPQPSAPPGAVCPCGNLNPAGARFCTKCGRPL